MTQSIGQIAIVVRDYDEALIFYVDLLGFQLIEDTRIHEQDKRWVVVAPPGLNSARLLLARAVGDEQLSRIGNQTGGRVFLFLIPMISGATFARTRPRALSSFGSRRKRATAQSPCLRTFMATCGICCSSGRWSPRFEFGATAHNPSLVGSAVGRRMARHRAGAHLAHRVVDPLAGFLTRFVLAAVLLGVVRSGRFRTRGRVPKTFLR